MKGVFISDPHIGDYPYGKTDAETGLNSRLLDVLDNFDQAVKFAIEKKVDVFFIAGDIYRVKHPNSKIRRQFASRLKPLILHGIRTILMTGNHDMTTSSDNAHAMSEMEELSELIEHLEVYSEPKVIKIKDTELYILPFVNRGNNKLLTVQDFAKFQVEKIKEFNEQTKESAAKYKIFFGHFSTDKSVTSNSFDLNMSIDELNITAGLFEEGDWTKIYLGHIHKNQEFNKIMRHIGSTSRVDFSEMSEQKGFYYYDDGNDKYVPINDREFREFKLDLTQNHKNKMSAFLDEIQDYDLKKAIVKVKVDILQTYLPEIKFEGLESYLRESSWHLAGVEINTINVEEDKDKVINISSIDQPIDALKKYIGHHKTNFEGIEEDAIIAGTNVMKKISE
mgnify:CR=1 FL=1